MNSADLITMIDNLSRSLFPVQRLLSGGAYLLGILFFISALSKLKKIAGSGRQSSEKMIVPIAYLLGAAALLYLPTALNLMANTTFGVGNVLQYTDYNSYDFNSSMSLLIRTAGLIWFIRGCVLLVHASEPGEQHGTKGLVFLCAGILAINFQNTTDMINGLMGYLEQLTISVRNYQGY